MNAALAVGGTSFDSLYVNVNGESGYFDRSLRRLRPGGRAVPPLRHADAPPAVDEPVQLLLPALSAPAAPGPLVVPAGPATGRNL